MASHQQIRPVFWSTGDMQNVVLSYIATVEEGGAIGKSRNPVKLHYSDSSSHSATEFQHIRGTRIYSSKCRSQGPQVRVELSSAVLQDFQESPPPSSVTSLTLTNTEYLKKSLSPSETALWEFFMSFWKPRLESLELDVMAVPVHPPLRRFLRHSPPLRNLEVSVIKRNPNMPPRVPELLFRMNELSLYNMVDLSELKKDVLFQRISASRKLRRLKVVLSREEGESQVKRLVRLIEAKKNDKDFQLICLNLDFCSNWEVQRKFILSVVASSSTIRISRSFDLSEFDSGKWESEKEALEFFKKIERIPSFNGSVPFCLKNFPNLKRLDVLKIGAKGFPQSKKRSENTDCFPRSLRRLGIARDIPQIEDLPRILTRLDLMDWMCCANEFVEAMNSLGKLLRVLRDLRISWIWRSPAACAELGCRAKPQSPTDDKIESLKSLSLFTRIPFCCAHVTPRVLLHSLKANELELLSLTLGSSAREVDKDTLTALVEGRVGNSLVEVDIQESSVARDALPLLKTLKTVVSANKLKLLIVSHRRKGHEEGNFSELTGDEEMNELSDDEFDY